MLYDVCRAKRKTYVHVVTKLGTELINEVSSDYMSADGVYERLAGGIDRDISENTEYTRTVNGTTAAITEQQYEQYQKQYLDSSDYIVEINGVSWPTDGNHHSSYQSVLSQLNVKASTTPAPAAGTYGPYTITGTMYNDSVYTVSFSAARVEKKTVQVRTYGDGDPEFGLDTVYSSYENEAITFVTIKPDTKVTVSGGYNGEISVSSGKSDGNGKYSQLVMGAVESLRTSTGTGIFNDVAEGQDFIRIENYFIVVDETAAPAAPSGFTDIKAGAYYADAVKWAVEKKITSGTSKTTFSPNATCSKAQILTFLWRANGSPEPTAANPFTDIKTTDYFYKAALWAAEKGLVSGSTFGANTDCTRAMTVGYLWKAAGSPAASYNGTFNDVPASADYGQAVAWAVSQGITAGTSDTTFSPNATCTRGQIVTFLHRAMGK